MVILDNNQKSIVESKEKKIVVVAGAGSGKTAVLTQRIRHLIKMRDVKPSDITAITFTNMAADEMKERLSDIEGIEKMFVGTIHSFANHILRESGKHYGILSDDVYSELVQELIKSYCKHLTQEHFTEYENLLKDIKDGKAEKYEASDFFDCSEDYEFHMITRKYVTDDDNQYPESVYSLCKKRNILTFDELIIKAKAQLNGEVMRYVFVDEYQDVGNLEDTFIRALNAENYFIVGDDWQSIYGFKGANVSIFKHYVCSDEWKSYHLDNNYRNSTGVLSLAENVIKGVDNRLEKHVVAKNRDRGNVAIESKAKLSEQLRIIKLRKNIGDWFILTRTRKDLIKILETCKSINLPAVTFSKADFSLEELRALMKENQVKVLTIHAAKGLEANNVLLYGNFPIEMPKAKGGESEVKKEKRFEERRIMYVGITRAKNKLVVLN